MDGSAGVGANGMGHMSVMDEQAAAAEAAGVLMQGDFAGAGQRRAQGSVHRPGTVSGNGHNAAGHTTAWDAMDRDGVDRKATDREATGWIDQFLQPGVEAGVAGDGNATLFSRVTPGTAAE